MYKNEIEMLEKEFKVYNDTLNNGAEEIEIKALCENVKKAFNYELPSDYYQFLKECNGFEFNGHIIYSTDNLIDNNEDYESIFNGDYIIIGEYDISFFVIKIKDNSYWELDKTSGNEEQRFKSAEEMIKYVIIEAIK